MSDASRLLAITRAAKYITWKKSSLHAHADSSLMYIMWPNWHTVQTFDSCNTELSKRVEMLRLQVSRSLPNQSWSFRKQRFYPQESICIGQCCESNNVGYASLSGVLKGTRHCRIDFTGRNRLQIVVSPSISCSESTGWLRSTTRILDYSPRSNSRKPLNLHHKSGRGNSLLFGGNQQTVRWADVWKYIALSFRGHTCYSTRTEIDIDMGICSCRDVFPQAI